MSKIGIYNLTLIVEVSDEADLYKTAHARAVRQGMYPNEAQALLAPNQEIDAGQCLRFVLRNNALDGCYILQSHTSPFDVESYHYLPLLPPEVTP